MATHVNELASKLVGNGKYHPLALKLHSVPTLTHRLPGYRQDKKIRSIMLYLMIYNVETAARGDGMIQDCQRR
ncbi:hypothetical protein EVAR_37551_1 [Eumeta japonica]|uniref:Uncharacterized protein n=1 Tax=Eumeta variegata TaxID=151549 RepID=A0A4C1XV43_EUMVA|nr:hypothetical protein EVAR_37551_1 [Eumeta japonica]